MNNQPIDADNSNEWELDDVSPQQQAHYASIAITDVLEHADALGMAQGNKSMLQAAAAYLKLASEGTYA